MVTSGPRHALLAVLLAASSGGPAFASGFGLREGAADWMANAFAGDTAKAYDASTVYTNPAGMVRLNLNEVDASVNYIRPTARFDGTNQVGPTTFTTGSPGGNLVQDAATAGLFGVWSYQPNLKFGVSVTSPFGERVTNPGDFVGRYQSLVSSITDVQLTLAAAYAITPELSVGVGPVVNYIHTRLTQAINLGAINSRVGDPVADLRGENTSAGFVASVRFGLSYRSRIQHDIDGGQRIFVPPALSALSPLTAGQLLALSSTAKSQITLPDSITGGVYYDIAPNLAVFADLQWTHWSTFNNLTVVATNGLSASVTPERWRSTVFAAVGFNVKLTDKIMFQAGAGYDQSPVRDDNRTTRIPDYSRVLAGVGLSYTPIPNLTITGAYLKLFAGDAGINSAASATSGRIVGKYSDSADSASLGVKYRF